jgi:hypothetical protein
VETKPRATKVGETKSEKGGDEKWQKEKGNRISADCEDIFTMHVKA